jgi:hypothetical protein
MKKIILLTILAAFATVSISAQDDKKAAGDLIDKLWEGMRLKNAEMIKSVFTADGQLVAIDKPRDGKGISTTRVFTAEAFAKNISEAKAPEFLERMPSPDIKIFGDLAIVTGRYTFHVGDRFSHCGTNTFNLVRTETGWKVANGASTLEFQCDAEKGAAKPN